ncbi:MAG TPA: DUF4314 domain-containing protein [Patescibacteria group bacterium]|nr:DUF4314 domain-containing protein [Patescibacteria group bacterium]
MLDVKIGSRVRCISMQDDPDPVPYGIEGTVMYANDDPQFSQIGVDWDNGRNLALLPKVDRYSVVTY